MNYLIQNILTEKDKYLLKNITYKDYLNKTRIQSKQVHQLLTQLEYNVYSDIDNIVIFGTLLYNPEMKWYEKGIKTTQDFLIYMKNKLNKFIESESFDIFLYSIELHKGYKLLKNKNLQEIKLIDDEGIINMFDNLFSYPHIHFLLIKKLNIIFDKKQKERINDFISYLYKYFEEFDCNFQNIQQNEKRFYLKKKFIYILKEFRLNEVFYEEKYKIILKNQIYKELLQKINSYYKIKLLYKITINNNYFLSNEPEENVLDFIIFFLNKFELKVFKNKLYKLQKDTKFTWIYWGTFSEFYSLLYKNKIEVTFLVKYIKRQINFLKENKLYILDNLTFNNFQFIEYKDFVFDLFNIKFIYKPEFNSITFKYYDKTLYEIRNMDNSYSILLKLFIGRIKYESDNYYKMFDFLSLMGNILSNIKVKKGETLYLYGVPNSGKSLLVENFLTDLYGKENIGIINFSDRKYFLEQCKDKKIIIINEYKHNLHLREIMLKVFDNSFIDLNQKYKISEMISLGQTHKTILSNYSPKEQNFDEAMNKRIVPVKLLNDFTELRINYKEFIEAFVVFPIIFTSAFYYKRSNIDSLIHQKDMYSFLRDQHFSNYSFLNLLDLEKKLYTKEQLFMKYDEDFNVKKFFNTYRKKRIVCHIEELSEEEIYLNILKRKKIEFINKINSLTENKQLLLTSWRNKK